TWKPPVEGDGERGPETRLAENIAGQVRAMVGRERRESKGRPVQACDVVGLVRRRRGVVAAPGKALKDRNVAVTGVDRMVLTDQLAVIDLIALGRFVLLPDDDLNLACVLKSPLVGLDEDGLFRAANGRGETRLWQALRERAKGDAALAA